MVVQSRPLIEVWAEIPDFRPARGKRHPLAALLALACAAMRCGYRSYRAIAAWGRNDGHALTRALGFAHPQTPCAATLHSSFRHLDRAQLEAQLGSWAEGVMATTPAPPEEPAGIVLDGKTLWGSKKQGLPGAHLRSALGHRLGLTLAQQAGPDQTNEIATVQDVLREVVRAGCVVTVDALRTQRAVVQALLDGDGD